MAISCSILTPSLISFSPITGEPAKISRRRVILPLLVEAKIKEAKKLQVHDSKDVSRRNTILYLTAGVVGWINIFHGEAAEARVGRQENRRKALEKLRKKAIESEPKSRNQKEEKELDTELFPLLPPTLRQEAIVPLVEAILP